MGSFFALRRRLTFPGQQSKRADMGWGLFFFVSCSEFGKAGQYVDSSNGFRSYGSSGMSGLNLFMYAMMYSLFSLLVGASVICAFRSPPQGQKSPFTDFFACFS
jgi:hypothetical protein